MARATAASLKELTREQATLATWISRRYKVAPEPIAALVKEAWSIGQRAGLARRGAQRAGASRQALVGAALGTVVGLFMGLVGVLFMPLVGAAAGEYVARRNQQQAMKVGVPVSKVAKWKTTAQMFALAFLLAGPAGDKVLPYTTEAGITLLWIAAILTIYTGYDYFRAGAKHMVD